MLHAFALLGYGTELCGHGERVHPEVAALMPPNTRVQLFASTGDRPTRIAARWRTLRQDHVAVTMVSSTSPRSLLMTRAAELRSGQRLYLDLFDVPRRSWGTNTLPRDDGVRRLLAGRTNGAVAASRFLQSWAARAGLSTVLIPAVFPPLPNEEAPSFSAAGGGLHIAFAGTAWSKDEDTLIALDRALASVKREVTVHVVGPPPRDKFGGVKFRWHGRRNLLESRAIVSRCDVVVLVRPPDRLWARAGFPSKLAEAWQLGVPVIVNDVGDQARYLVPAGNGVLLGSKPELGEVLEFFDRAALWPVADIKSMGERCFGVATAAEQLQDLLANSAG